MVLQCLVPVLEGMLTVYYLCFLATMLNHEFRRSKTKSFFFFCSKKLYYQTLFRYLSCNVCFKNVWQPSCIARGNQYSGHFNGREIQVFILNP